MVGEVTRPAVYELLPDETLRQLIDFAGGFGPSAYQARVRIHRILPPESRRPGGGARVGRGCRPRTSSPAGRCRRYRWLRATRSRSWPSPSGSGAT